MTAIVDIRQRARDKDVASGAVIVDVLVAARAAYDSAIRLNARHRERRGVRDRPAECSREDEAAAYRQSVDAVEALGRVMARLRVLVEDGTKAAA